MLVSHCVPLRDGQIYSLNWIPSCSPIILRNQNLGLIIEFSVPGILEGLVRCGWNTIARSFQQPLRKAQWMQLSGPQAVWKPRCWFDVWVVLTDLISDDSVLYVHCCEELLLLQTSCLILLWMHFCFFLNWFNNLMEAAKQLQDIKGHWFLKCCSSESWFMSVKESVAKTIKGESLCKMHFKCLETFVCPWCDYRPPNYERRPSLSLFSVKTTFMLNIQQNTVILWEKNMFKIKYGIKPNA